MWKAYILGYDTQAVFSEDDIAYQMGESTEIHSGGLFQATLHCVQVQISLHHALKIVKCTTNLWW